jgi:hypothetical protein
MVVYTFHGREVETRRNHIRYLPEDNQDNIDNRNPVYRLDTEGWLYLLLTY